jgi:non-ribosomal peptide synthetase component E (peptide arylation enzyme)
MRFLAEALNDPAEEVWQQALDGLVAFSLPSSLKVLQSARSRKFTEETAAKRFNLWLEEAIQQVELELRSKV